MNSRKLTILTIIAGVLALGEFGSALMIWLEQTGPAAGALLAVLFGLFFLLGAWLLRSARPDRRHHFRRAAVPSRGGRGPYLYPAQRRRLDVPDAHQSPARPAAAHHPAMHPLPGQTGRVLGQLHRRPDSAPAWCLSCCEGLDRDRCDMIPFGS